MRQVRTTIARCCPRQAGNGETHDEKPTGAKQTIRGQPVQFMHAEGTRPENERPLSHCGDA